MRLTHNWFICDTEILVIIEDDGEEYQGIVKLCKSGGVSE